MNLQLHCHGDIDLSQRGMQVEIRSHIARCLRDYPQGGEGVITLAGVEHCFMYVVQNDVVDTVIGPPDYIEQVLNDVGKRYKKGSVRCLGRTTTEAGTVSKASSRSGSARATSRGERATGSSSKTRRRRRCDAKRRTN